MKVEFLKRHQGHSKGDVEEVIDALARYWLMCGVVKKHTQKRVRKPKENKNGKPNTEDK